MAGWWLTGGWLAWWWQAGWWLARWWMTGLWRPRMQCSLCGEKAGGHRRLRCITSRRWCRRTRPGRLGFRKWHGFRRLRERRRRRLWGWRSINQSLCSLQLRLYIILRPFRFQIRAKFLRVCLQCLTIWGLLRARHIWRRRVRHVTERVQAVDAGGSIWWCRRRSLGRQPRCSTGSLSHGLLRFGHRSLRISQ